MFTESMGSIPPNPLDIPKTAQSSNVSPSPVEGGETRDRVDSLSEKLPQVSTTSSDGLYRYVFTNCRNEFKAFLETIFYQLDTEKVFKLMDEILNDQSISDEEIYKELLARIHTTKKRFAPLYQAFKALPVLCRGMGKQVGEHIEDFEKERFEKYLEISTRRYVKGIESETGLSFKEVGAVSDEVTVSPVKRFEAGGISYPYKELFSINDEDCQDYVIETEKTYKPLGDEIADNSQDMIVCLGGLHHIPEERIDPFVQSLYKKLKPGGLLFLRDHNASDEKTKHLASVVHSFVNAVDGISLEGEKKEIHNFQSEEHWKGILNQSGFEQVNDKSLVLPEDPTQNAMTLFVKPPTTEDEVENAAQYRKGYQRSSAGSYATWVEWGNVRLEKQYAEFIQNHHSYAFDHIGQIKQVWAHFYNAIKSSLKQPDVNIKDLLFSDNTAMNLFITVGTIVDLSLKAIISFPSACFARVKYGEKWRDVVNLSALEKFEAEFKDDYSKFIDYEPFFRYPYFQKIGEMWTRIYHSNDSFFTKIGDVVGGISFTASTGVQGLLSLFIDNVYYSSGNDESSASVTTHYLIDDPNNELEGVIQKWNEQKMETEFNGKRPFEDCNIKVIYSVGNRKLVSVPYYKPFTEITKLMADTGIQLIKTGGQEKITLDICLKEGEELPNIEQAELIYDLERLQDDQKRRYYTYEVPVSKLLEFCKDPRVKNHIEYIHVHR